MKRKSKSGGKRNPNKSQHSPFLSSDEEAHLDKDPLRVEPAAHVQPEEEKKGGPSPHQLSSGSVLGKRKATHLPMREDASKNKPAVPA
jgi:hypothetical protein